MDRSSSDSSFAEIPSHEAIIAEIKSTLAANNMTGWRSYPSDTHSRREDYNSGMDPRLNQAGPTLIVLAEFKAPVYDKSGIGLITSGDASDDAGRAGPEHSSQQLAELDSGQDPSERRRPGRCLNAGDAQGFVAETNATHIFLVHNGTVLTSRGQTLARKEYSRDVCSASVAHIKFADEVRSLSCRSLPSRRNVLHRDDGRAGGRHKDRQSRDR